MYPYVDISLKNVFVYSSNELFFRKIFFNPQKFVFGIMRRFLLLPIGKAVTEGSRDPEPPSKFSKVEIF
jgi:hypothetical protein